MAHCVGNGACITPQKDTMSPDCPEEEVRGFDQVRAHLKEFIP